MPSNYRELSKEAIRSANDINNRLIEKSLAMRCSSYLSQVKAQLLTDTIYEIDNRKKALFNINSRLEQEISERKLAEEELHKAKIEAEEATKLKDKFVALVSHDLKNPLSVINGYLDLLMTIKDMPPNASKMIESAQQACKSMTVLITDILNVSRIHSGGIKLVRSDIDLSDAINSAINIYTMMANEKHVNLASEITPGTMINADEELLIEVISNLVSNAIKFSNTGDMVRIYLPNGDTSTIAISDTGTGIPKELLEGVFQYEQKTSTIGTGGETGTGFGLPLSYDIVKAHHGNLRIETEIGKGTTFYIDLPTEA